MDKSNAPQATTKSEKKESKSRSNNNLAIMEWRFNQFLGERLTYEEIRNDPENETFLVTDIKFTPDGSHVIVSDKGGRVITFKKSDTKGKSPKLEYFFEYVAQEKDFDVHKSIEYSEEVKAVSVVPSNSFENKLDIITAGFRTIRIDRIYKDSVKTFNSVPSSQVSIPKVSEVKNEIKSKTKRLFKCTHSNEINSLCVNKENVNNFISADEFKVFLWDINFDGREIYAPIDIESDSELDTVEKITKATYTNYDPHVFLYGTNRGNIKLCDLRAGSESHSFATNFSDERSDIANSIANSLLCVHDINTNISGSNYTFATRHYFSVNLWDMRKTTEPSSKFLIYEHVINKLTYLYQNNYINDKFSLDTDPTGKYVLTGGYNNMFHVIDTEQRLNTQIVIDDSNQRLMNTNIIRKINAKGSCYYKKDDPSLSNINFDKKILHQAYSPVGNYALLIVLNCIYSYSGNIAKKNSK